MERVTSRKTHPRPNGKQLLAANWRRLALANPVMWSRIRGQVLTVFVP